MRLRRLQRPRSYFGGARGGAAGITEYDIYVLHGLLVVLWRRRAHRDLRATEEEMEEQQQNPANLRAARAVTLVEPFTWWIGNTPVLVDTAEGAHTFAQEEGLDPAILYTEALHPVVTIAEPKAE